MTALLDRPSAGPPGPQPVATAAPPATTPRWRRHAPLAAVSAVALALNSWALSINGVGNQYYAAAARGMTASWSNFFFASYDQGGFISVDKPPVFLWIDAVSVRLFGFSSWSLLLPSAIAGAASVALLYRIVERRFGPVAATIAGLVLALSPVNVAVNRLNLPEPFLILFLVAAAWAVLRSLDSGRPLRWLVLAGTMVGLAFNTKMLAAAIPLPALGIAVLVGTTGWGERLKRGLVFGVTALATSLPWLVIVDLIPASARPYVGGSTNDTVWDLVFGYNGFGRVNGTGTGMGGTGGGGFGNAGAGTMNAAGGIFGGAAGPFRLVSEAIGGQIAWLLPLALIGAGAAFWHHRHDRSRRAALVLWTGWFVLYAVVFSKAAGTFHAYYVSVMLPAVAAMVGIGAAALVALARRHRWWLAVLALTALLTVEGQLVLSGREPAFYGWTRVVLVAFLAAAAVGLAVGLVRRRGRVVVAALAIGLAGLLVSPAAWAVSETANPVLNATLPQAGPRTGSAGSSFGSASSNGDPALIAWLQAHQDGETWDLVVANAQQASGLMADGDLSVMALGGFMGTDGAATVASFADQVATGQVRWVLVSSTGGRGGGGGMMGGGTATSVLSAAQQSCAAVTDPSLPTAYQGRLYDCAGQAEALRTLA